MRSEYLIAHSTGIIIIIILILDKLNAIIKIELT